MSDGMPMFFGIVLAPRARDVCPTLGLMFECSCSCPSVLVLVPVFEYSSVGECSNARAIECWWSSARRARARVLVLVLVPDCFRARAHVRVLECR